MQHGDHGPPFVKGRPKKACEYAGVLVSAGVSKHSVFCAGAINLWLQSLTVNMLSDQPNLAPLVYYHHDRRSEEHVRGIMSAVVEAKCKCEIRTICMLLSPEISSSRFYDAPNQRVQPACVDEESSVRRGSHRHCSIYPD